jgi:hypothetical protein
MTPISTSTINQLSNQTKGKLRLRIMIYFSNSKIPFLPEKVTYEDRYPDAPCKILVEIPRTF